MGWFGYDIYDGDGTQTEHYTFLKWAKVSNNSDEISNWLNVNGTILPEDKKVVLLKNLKLIIKRMPKVKFWNEDKALMWQMLGALFIDNKLKIPKVIKYNAILATEYLMCEHSDDFIVPSKRRRYLKKFIENIKKLKGSDE